ncbi:MAG TPA: hypothetical protein VIG42_01165 [Solirubrobacteraceae bacterium]
MSANMHGCTITTSHYMAHARVMAESFLAHNPGADFTVLMIDDWSGAPPERESFRTLTLADVGIDEQEFNRRATMYITQGLANSMKADLMLAVLAEGHEQVLYLDADACVYADLSHLGDLAERHSLVLSPHSHDPYPLWEVDSPEQVFMRAGVMNAGLIGAGQGGRPFLEWWAERLARRCVFDLPRALLVDQTWLMLAPALFDHHILRDRGCNVAGWNLHTRDVRWEGDVPTIDGGPLRHFHFAMTYDPEHPERLTASEKASWWPTLRERPGVARLSLEYAERLLGRGYREVRHAPPLFDAMPGGAPIEPWMRASYRAALIHAEVRGEAEPPNPFSDGEERFTAWIEPRTVERLAVASEASNRAPATSASGGSTDAGADHEEPFSADEMAQAMMDTGKLLARIRELEGIRDEAVAWAERASGELEQAKGAIAERDKLIAQQGAALEARLAQLDEVWHSPSWRLTSPLRAVKGLFRGESP